MGALLDELKARNKQKEPKTLGLREELVIRKDSVNYNELIATNQSAVDTINRYQETMKNDGYMSAEDLAAYKSAVDTYTDTGNRMRSVAKYLGVSYNDEDENAWQSSLLTLGSNYDSAYQHYSKFKTEDAYKEALESLQLRTEKLSFDTVTGQQELDELNIMGDEYMRKYQLVGEYWLTGGIGLSEHEVKAMERWMSDAEAKYGFTGADGLKGLISTKTAYLNDAKRLQAWDALEAVGNPEREEYDPEFDQFSGYVSDKDGSERGYDPVYEAVNYKSSGYRFSSASEELDYEPLAYMEDEEVATYNYYYAKHGKEAADEYLELIRDVLNLRIAEKDFEPIKGKMVLEWLYSPIVSIERFGKNLLSIFNTEGKYIPPTPNEYLSDMIREDLDGVGPELPEWLGGASLGQGVYDAISTVSYMAPSILASIAVGKVSKKAGIVTADVLLGGAAGGAAYQEKLNAGYSQEQAATYGALVCASEATLRYLLSGVSKLGGTLTKTALNNLSMVDDVLSAFAKSSGVRLVANGMSELAEEYLQAILEPYLWEAVSGEEMSVDRAEALYSALLGFATGFLFEGGEIAVENHRYTKSGQAILKGGRLSGLQELAAKFAGTDGKIAKIASQVSDKSSGKNARRVGRLYSAVTEAVSKQNRLDLANGLIQKGVNTEIAGKLAEVTTQWWTGGELSDAGLRLLSAAVSEPEIAEAISRVHGQMMPVIKRLGQIREGKAAVSTATEEGKQNAATLGGTEGPVVGEATQLAAAQTAESLYDRNEADSAEVAAKSGSFVENEATGVGVVDMAAQTDYDETNTLSETAYRTQNSTKPIGVASGANKQEAESQVFAESRKSPALSEKEYGRLLGKQPIKATKKDWEKTGQARMQRYASLQESDIPEIDVFLIAEYNKPNLGYIYTVRNHSKDSYAIIQKKQMKPQTRVETREVIESEQRNNKPAANSDALQERSGRGTDRGVSNDPGNGGKLSENDGRAVRGGESVTDMADRQSDSDSGAGGQLTQSDGANKQKAESQVFAESRKSPALSEKEYARLLGKKPVKTTKQEWAMVEAQRKTKYSTVEEADVPVIDVFWIGDYRTPNSGYSYYIRNGGADSFSIVMRKKIKDSNKEVIADERQQSNARTDTDVNSAGSRGRGNRGDSVGTGNGGKLSEDDGRAVQSGESVTDVADRQSDSDSGAGGQLRQSVQQDVKALALQDQREDPRRAELEKNLQSLERDLKAQESEVAKKRVRGVTVGWLRDSIKKISILKKLITITDNALKKLEPAKSGQSLAKLQLSESGKSVETSQENALDFYRTNGRIKINSATEQDAVNQVENVTAQNETLTAQGLLDRIGEFVDVSTLTDRQQKALDAYKQQKQYISELEASRQTHENPAKLDSQIAKEKEKLQKIQERKVTKSVVNRAKQSIYREYVNAALEKIQLKDVLNGYRAELSSLQDKLESEAEEICGQGKNHADLVANYEAKITQTEEALQNVEKELERTKATAGAIIEAEDRRLLLFDDQQVSTVNGKRVITNSSFDLDIVDEEGRTNRQKMKQGYAPTNAEGIRYNIHHIDQTNDGTVLVIPESLHQKYDSMLHSNKGQSPSQIDRVAFAKWRRSFWKWLLQQLNE